MATRFVRFKNSIGYGLAGIIETPPEAARYPVVVFSHGFESGKDSPRNKPIADRLVSAGMAAFLIDFTGHGESEGSLDESTFERQVDDLVSALDFIVRQPEVDERRIGLNGSSSGAMVAAYVALEQRPIGALVFRAPRFDHLVLQASKLKPPVRIVQGDLDPLLQAQTMPFFEALTCEKDLVVIRGGTHLFEDPGHFRQVVELTSDWFENHLIKRWPAAKAA